MRLPVQLVESFEDDQLNFEALQGVLTTPGTALSFLQLLAAENIAISWGTGTATWTAAANSAASAVNHGLGRVPVFAIAIDNANHGTWYNSEIGSATTTHVAFVGWFGSTITGAFPFSWLAIG